MFLMTSLEELKRSMTWKYFEHLFQVLKEKNKNKIAKIVDEIYVLQAIRCFILKVHWLAMSRRRTNIANIHKI